MLAVLGFAFLIGVAGPTSPAAAQPGEVPTNLEVLQSLAVECLSGAVPDSMLAFRLDAPEQRPYLRTALVRRWQGAGRRMYVTADSASTPLPTLAYDAEAVEVAYARARRRAVERTVTLALQYTLTAADGRLLRDTRCRDTYTDTVPREAMATLESAAHPETQADPPPGGWLRRYAQPAVVAAATVVTAFLFFSLRSDRVDN